jgi:hypothetical protein
MEYTPLLLVTALSTHVYMESDTYTVCPETGLQVAALVTVPVIVAALATPVNATNARRGRSLFMFWKVFNG